MSTTSEIKTPPTLEKTEKRNQANTEYERTTAGLRFTKDFNSSLEAIIRDPESTWEERFTAWLKRYAWGERSLFAIRPDGNPRTLADAAKELGRGEHLTSARASISHAASYLESRNYLRRDGKKLYPVIDPQPPQNPGPKKVAHSHNFAEFLEH